MPLPRPGWRITHRRTHISRSPLLLREVRRGFSEERQFHFQLAVAALELPHPLVIRHSFRERLPGTLLPVCFHPKAEGGVIYFEFPRYLGDRQGVIDYLPGSLLLELRSVSFRFSRHSFPSFPGENPIGSPVRKRWGTSFGTYRSQVQEETIRALGATPVVAFGPVRSHALGSGQIQGFELDLSRYVLLAGLAAGAPYVAANVALWPELDVLIASPGRLASLTAQQRTWLRQAADGATKDSVGLAASGNIN